MENKKTKITERIQASITPAYLSTAGFLLAVFFTTYLYFGNPNIDIPADLILRAAGRGDTARTAPAIVAKTFPNTPVVAKAVAIYDVQTQKFIYTKNGSAQLPLASLAKIANAVTAMRITGSYAVGWPAKFNDHNWKISDLIKISLVASSNSAAASVASALDGIVKNNNERINFVSEMNNLAKMLGLKQTYFVNETGLDVNEKVAGAYGSAQDIAKLFAHAVKKYPEVFGITKYENFTATSLDGYTENAKNTNIDIAKMTTVIASKTGTTDLAGGNLVIAFDAGLSRPVIIAILGSTPEARFADVEALSRATIDYLK